MGLDVRSGTAHDVDTVTAVLALAFRDDPVWGTWTFPDPTDRVDRLRGFWAPFVRAALKHDGVRLTGGGEAVALWVPPGLPELDDDDEAALDATARELCGDRAPDVAEAFTRFAANRPTADHWYLTLLGTHPEHRGRGIGMALVDDHLTAVVDTARLPAYLESTNRANLARYERAGFRPHSSFPLPDGPSVDTMWRPAR